MEIIDWFSNSDLLTLIGSRLILISRPCLVISILFFGHFVNNCEVLQPVPEFVNSKRRLVKQVVIHVNLSRLLFYYQSFFFQTFHRFSWYRFEMMTHRECRPAAEDVEEYE